MFDMMDPYGEKEKKQKQNNGNKNQNNNQQGNGNQNKNQGQPQTPKPNNNPYVPQNPWGFTNYSQGDNKQVIGVNGKTYRNAAAAAAAGVAVKKTQTPKMTKYDNRDYKPTPPVVNDIFVNQGKKPNQEKKEQKLTARDQMQRMPKERGFLGADGKMYNPFPFTDYGSLETKKGTRDSGYPSATLPGAPNRSKQKTPSISPADFSKMMSDISKFVSPAVNMGVDIRRGYQLVSLDYLRSVTKGNTIAGMSPKYDPVYLEMYNRGEINKQTLDNRGLIEGVNYSKPGSTKNGKLVAGTGYGVKGSKGYSDIARLKELNIPAKYLTPASTRSKPMMPDLKNTKFASASAKNEKTSIDTGVPLIYQGLIKEKQELEERLAVTPGAFKARSKARSEFQLADLKSSISSDYMEEANKIRGLMGQPPISITTKRVKMNDGYNKYKYSYSADPIAVLNDYYTKKGVVDWALNNTDIQPTYALDKDVSTLQAEKNAIIARGSRTSTKPTGSTDLWIALSGVTGQYPTKVQQGSKVVTVQTYQQEGVFLKSRDDYQRVQEIDSVLNQTGDKGVFSYYDKIMGEAERKKKEYTKYAKPFEDKDKEELASVSASLTSIERTLASQPRYRSGGSLAQELARSNKNLYEQRDMLAQKKAELEGKLSSTIFDYASIPNEELTKIAEYHGALQTGSSNLSKGISQLEEGIEALNIKTGRGTTSKLRAGMFDYKASIPVLDSLMQSYYPIEEKAKQKASQVQLLSTQKTILDGTARNKIADLVKGGMLSYGQIEPEQVKQTFTSKISNIRNEAKSLDSDAERRTAVLSGYVWNPDDPSTTSSSTSLTRQAEMRAITVQKQKAVELNAAANALESDLGFVLANKQYIETIVPPIATIKGIGDAGLSRTSKYSFAGGRTLTIPKDQIPADGKVTVQLSYSFTPNAVADLSSNIGSLGVTGSAGNPNFPGASRGEGVIVADLPVDKEGNINLSFNLTGKKKYEYGGTLQLHDAIIYQPMNEQQKNMMKATQSSLEQEQQQLSALESQKQFIKNAQSFITGGIDTFSTDKGVVASISGGKAVVANPDEFSKFFGGISPQTIGDVRNVYGSLSTVASKKAQLQSSIATLSKLKPEDIPAPVEIPKQVTTTVDENYRPQGWSSRTTDRYRTYVLNQGEINAAIAHNQNIEKLKSDLETRDTQISTLNEGIKNVDTLAKFITGDVPTLEIVTGGTPKTIARRMQTGYVDILDKTEYDKIGFSLPVLPDVKIGEKIEDLEIEVEAKQKTTDELYAKVKALGSDYVSSTIQASIDSLTQMKKKGLISPGDYRKEVNKLNAEKATVDNAIATDLYFPSIDELDTDLKSDAEEIREGTTKNIKSSLRQQALQQSQSVSRPRIPQGSAVGSAQRAIQRPTSEPMPNMTTTLGSTGMVAKNPFLDPKY